MTAKDVFDQAMRSYDKAKETIAELTALAKQVSPDFSYELAMKEFDSVLQAILLSVAASDGVVTNYERQLVEKITDYADILVALNNAAGTDLSWDDLEGAPADQLTKLAEAVVNINKEVAADFVVPFAMIDSVTGKNYLDALVESLGDIAGCLAAIDGDSADSNSRKAEFANAVNAMNFLIINTWNKVKNS